MTSVIKRNKHRQAFSQRKLARSIEKAVREAKLGTKRAKELAREIGTAISKSVRRKKSVRSTELRRMVFRRLESKARSAMSAWRRFERKRKKYR